MPRNKFAFIALSAILFSGSAALTLANAKPVPGKPDKAAELEAPVPGAVTVSDYEFNTFAFPGTIKRILFPAGSPVMGKPIYLSDNTQVMLQFTKGSDKSIQLVAEMEGGQTVVLRVVPRAIPGITHAVNGARVRSAPAAALPRTASGDTARAGAPRSDDVELLKSVVSKNEPPAGFESVKLPAPTRFDKFSVIPLAGWANGTGKRIFVFSLVAVPGQTAVVASPQFYRAGITAVMLDGDVVDAEASPQLYVVEESNDE